jgi:putative endonuclease
MASSKTYYVYILASASRVLYTGITSNLERRVAEHQQSVKDGFSKRYRVRELVYFETFGDIRAAIAREKQINGWVRARKIASTRIGRT